jgi:class 3 adenylate cyclase
MKRSSAKTELLQSIELTLRDEARRNELRIAFVRLGVTGFTFAVDVLAWLSPGGLFAGRELPAINALVAGGLFVITLLVAVGLQRGWYRPSLRFIMPAFDAGGIALLFSVLVASGQGQASYADVALILLAASGGLRFTRGVVVLATTLSLLVYALTVVTQETGPVRAILTAGAIIIAGLLGESIRGIVGRATESEVGRATLRRFLPPQVIDDAHSNPMSLLTAPKSLVATVMVSDLRGFTSMAEHLSPVEVFDFLNEVQGTLAEAVRRHGGLVDKFMGDGMLAVFGAPEPVADHAERALQAASSILVAMKRLNASRRARNLASVGFGIGIHTGPLVSGCLGSGARLEFTVIGDTVNVTARIEALTKDRNVQVLVSDETVRSLSATRGASGYELHEQQAEAQLRGRREPLRVFALEPSLDRPEDQPTLVGRVADVG